MHVGLIGGIGPAATEYYYRGLYDAKAAWADPDRTMDLTIAHAENRTLVANFTAGRYQEQAEIFAGLIERLKGAGAEAAVVTSMGGHFCIEQLRPISPLPMIDILPVLNNALADRGYKRVGLLGTFRVMETGAYGALTDVDWAAPAGDDLMAVHETYIAMATAGMATDAQRAHLFAAGRSLYEDQGVDVVVLAGTDAFLAFQGHDCGFPIIDSADIHIAEISRQLQLPTP